MTSEEKLKEASDIQIFQTIAGCYEFIELAKNEIKRRYPAKQINFEI